MILEEHTGQKIKNILSYYELTDSLIIKETRFEQSYLSKIYTSRIIQPRNVKNFIYVINKVFNLHIDAETIIDKKEVLTNFIN